MREGAALKAGGATLLACLGMLAGGCGRDTAPPDAAPGDPTLAAIRSEVFEGSCALGSCHARPTLAAKLDLHDNGLCHLLVRSKSCLFSGKLLVVPGKPEASFLMDKLRGNGLSASPDPDCATSNERMPLGQPALSGNQLAQVEKWITDGADCGGDIPADAAVDAPADGPVETIADVASLSAVDTTLHVGQRTTVTVTLAHGAPPDGETVILEADDVAILGVPAAVHLDHRETSKTFEVLGKMVGPATLVTASAGTTSRSVSIAVIP